MRYKSTWRCAVGAALLLMTLASGACRAQTVNKKPAQLVPGSAQATRLPNAEIVVPVAVGVRTDKKIYHAGEPIKITITAKNATKSAVKLTFPSGQRYDIAIQRGSDPKSPKLWQWSHGQMFIQMVSSVALPPGKTLTFTENYRPGQERAPVLTPGTYQITGTLTTMGNHTHPFGATRITVR